MFVISILSAIPFFNESNYKIDILKIIIVFFVSIAGGICYNLFYNRMLLIIDKKNKNE